MFINSTHLPQVLTAEQYTSNEQHEQEMSRLFRPAWHYVGTIADAPRDGDFFTVTLLGQPLIVWNRSGGFQTFLNVCPHRFSLITEAKCGHAGDRLRCRYHGWEFDETGNTRKIPDARSFKPMEQGVLGLTGFRTETCGRLIFVTLADDAPDLAEFLGEGHRTVQRIFPLESREMLTLDYEVEANWKVKVENTLESYHIEMVHPKTFIRMPDADVCSHEFDTHWTTFTAIEEAPTPTRRFLDRMIHRLAGVEIEPEYEHYIYYPHIMFGKVRMSSWVEVIYPISPTRCRIMLRTFFLPGASRGLRAEISYRLIRQYSRKFGPTAAKEDSAAIVAVQKGLSAEQMPSAGMLSVREERVFHFQEYVQRATGDARAAVPSVAGSEGFVRQLQEM